MKKADYDKDGDGEIDLPVDKLQRLLDAAQEKAVAEMAQRLPTNATGVIAAYFAGRKNSSP